MIRANELRIGNLVEVFDESPVKVLAISDKNIALHFDSTKHMVAELHQIVPIPLTEEWLVKFGFERVVFDSDEVGYGYEYRIELCESRDYIVVCEDASVGTYSDGEMAHVVYPLKYHVHQLQNLYFALTGEELTIKE